MTTTTNAIDSQRLATAMRRKFGTVRNLLKALGLDEKFLTTRLALDEEVAGAPAGNAAAALRLELEKLLAGHEGDLPSGFAERFVEALRKHLPLNGDQEPERSIMRNGEVDPGAEAEELRRRERRGEEALDTEEFAKFLRGKGVDEETISGAMKLVGDAFPPNALPHGGTLGRGEGPGAKFAQKRAAGADARLERKGFSVARIESWGAADRSVERQSVPGAAQLARTFERFPGLANIGVHGGS